jgi:hypothetical protein
MGAPSASQITTRNQARVGTPGQSGQPYSHVAADNHRTDGHHGDPGRAEGPRRGGCPAPQDEDCYGDGNKSGENAYGNHLSERGYRDRYGKKRDTSRAYDTCYSRCSG